MNKERKIREAGKAANRLVFSRTVKLMVVFGLVIFLPLIWQLYQIQIVHHDELEEKAINQQTSELSVSASRGTIYDANGNVLAISSTAYDVIISPKAIVDKQADLDKKKESAREKAEEKNKDASQTERDKAVAEAITPYDWNVEDVVCTNLAEILDLDESELRTKCQKTTSQYQRLAIKVDRDTEDQVRELMESYSLSGCIYLQPNTKRYYPYANLAAQIIGFTNDNGGAYGLEAGYETQLAGEAGLVVTAKNAAGTDLMNFFQDYYDAEDGSNLHLTLDATIQSYCENYLEKYCKQYDTQNGGLIIVMECDTGAILGMAMSPTFDLNNYSEVIDETLLAQVEENAQEKVKQSEAEVKEAIAKAEEEDTELTPEEKTPLTYEEAYKIAYSEALSSQWTNKAITDNYEPGSTFKALVLAAGLEEGVIDENSTFECGGSVQVDTWTIRCSNRNGHGHQTLAEAIGHSCNPALISIGQKLGKETFYEYFYNFGLMDPTGIDLPYENSSNIWPQEEFGITQLATASFGQRFTVTPIQMITAFNAVINGGYLYTPYVVDSVTDQNGSITYEADTTPVRQVISESTSQRCAEILEGVVSKYTGKQAYQAGYRIGGKTGTSETLDKTEEGKKNYIVSFMGFAPADDPDVIALVIFDRPKNVGGGYTANGEYISGGNMAAPVAGKLLADILDYRGYERSYSSDDLTGAPTEVPNLSGMTENQAEQALKEKQLDYRTVGSGETVTGQIPSAGNYIPQNSTVILYMGEEAPTDAVEMPNLKGLSPKEAMETLNSRGLFMKASGASSSYSSNIVCVDQSVAPGTMTSRGYVVTVEFGDSGGGSGDADIAARD
ncbi:MAG: penicillin-binding transpeptidase domain-containing protein [Candidatus Onthomonas sp.]